MKLFEKKELKIRVYKIFNKENENGNGNIPMCCFDSSDKNFEGVMSISQNEFLMFAKNLDFTGLGSQHFDVVLTKIPANEVGGYLDNNGNLTPFNVCKNGSVKKDTFILHNVKKVYDVKSCQKFDERSFLKNEIANDLFSKNFEELENEQKKEVLQLL